MQQAAGIYFSFSHMQIKEIIGLSNAKASADTNNPTKCVEENLYNFSDFLLSYFNHSTRNSTLP